jgi:hypothetical protein
MTVNERKQCTNTPCGERDDDAIVVHLEAIFFLHERFSMQKYE